MKHLRGKALEKQPLRNPEVVRIEMQSITVRKSEGFSVKSPIKVYDLERNGVSVGTLQTWGRTWQVFDACLNQVASHSTIKAAVRVAGRVL